MLNDIKVMLGDAANNFSDALILLLIKQATSEVEAYTKRDLDAELEYIVERIVLLKLNKINAEGLSAQSYSGITESYIEGYPADILAVLNRKRKLVIL